MVSNKNIFGVFAAAVTPLDQEGNLVLDDWPIFLEFLAKRGCHGALLLGTSGEGPSFSVEERLGIVRAAVSIRQSFPDFQLFAGTGTPSLEETIAITKGVFEFGVDGVVVLPPYYYRNVGEDGLFSWYSQVIRRAVPYGANVLVYHIPSISGIGFSYGLIARLLDTFPGYGIGIKDSSTDPDFASELGKRFSKSLMTFSGTDSLFDLALANSASGCITALANLRSPDSRSVWEARSMGTTDPDSQKRLTQARSVMLRYPPNPPLLKALLHRIHGLPHWSVRAPLQNLSDEQTEKVLTDIRSELEAFET